jgi:hypothetical protein
MDLDHTCLKVYIIHTFKLIHELIMSSLTSLIIQPKLRFEVDHLFDKRFLKKKKKNSEPNPNCS